MEKFKFKTINKNQIIFLYNDIELKVLPGSLVNRYNFEQTNATLKTIMKYLMRDENLIQLSENLLYDKSSRVIKLISNIMKIPTTNEQKIYIDSGKDFNFYIPYYDKEFTIQSNLFTVNGLMVSKTLFEEIKKINPDKLLILKDILIDYDQQFIIDVYKNKDFNRKYKIFYETDFIEIA